jgi:ABC-2 type transport system ATP-binding protein
VSEQSAFWSKVADKYDRVVDLQIGGKTRSLVRERLTKESRLGDVVEFGCGTGFYTQGLAEKADTVVATDISPGMLDVARSRINAGNVRFQQEDCQATFFADGAFDTAFISLVLHFTEPRRTLLEMHRILKVGGTLIIANLDLHALRGLDRGRCLVRILYYGLAGYRVKPPKGFGKNMLREKDLRDLLNECRFKVMGSETIRDTSRSSNIPVEYIRAVKS